MLNVLTEGETVLHELRRCLFCHFRAQTQQNSDSGNTGSKELNCMTLQPNCALCNLYVADGESLEALLLKAVYEQR